MLETWRLIIDDPCDGATNMARDEAIAALHATGATQPTLRLYRWSPACLSLGRFQRGGEIDWAACERAGVAIVRRPSGGRALLHADELTYAVIARADHPLFGGESILETYRRISMALTAGLRRLGVAAEMAPKRSVEHKTHAAKQPEAGDISRSPVYDSRSSAACFDAPAAYELTVAGRKLAGSAQTRRAGCILQHGALPLVPHAERLSGLLRRPPVDLRAKMIALDQAVGRAVGFDEAADAIAAGFEQAWGIRLEPGELTAGERQEAECLRRDKYSDDLWTYGR